MATVTPPTSGLYEAVLQVLGNANSWTQSAAEPMEDLVEHLTASEAKSLPEAISGVLPLLRHDLDRLRFAAEIAAKFDFFEAAGTVLDLAIALGDRQLMLSAADLSVNPAVSASLRQRILDRAGEDRVSSRVVSSLAAFDGGSDVVKFGVTADGTVMVDRGKGFEDVLTGQMALDFPVTDVDAAFRPFDVGGGNAPGLPHASPNSTLNPIILNGTPHLTGKRIAAKDLASLDRAGGSKAIIAAYPELADESIDDVVEIGHRLLAAV